MKQTQRAAALLAAVLAAASIAACSTRQEASTLPPAPPTTPPPLPAGASPVPGPAPAPPPGTAPAPGGPAGQAALFGPDCGRLPRGGAPGSVAAMATQPVATATATNPLLRTLSAALSRAGVAGSLDSAPGITVFAPSDQGFATARADLGEQRYAALLADQNALGALLRYHVVGRRLDRAALDAAGTVPTLAGGPLRVTEAGGTLRVTDGAGGQARVVCGNIRTANATVYVIDGVLMPAKP